MKTISWRVCATMTTVIIVFIFTRRTEIALTVGGLEAIFKLLIYFLHERGWNKIRWGKHEIQPCVVWITGLSGSGKTSVAKKVVEKLRERGIKTDHLDGETIRDLFPGTGFSRTEVEEHIKRVGYLASRLEDTGVFVVASFISPYRSSREFVRALCKNFVEIYISTPLEVCIKRDHKNLYSRARRGEIKNLPGIDVEYEKPEHPHLTIDASHRHIEKASDKVMVYLNKFI